jgi:hypothetical protein
MARGAFIGIIACWVNRFLGRAKSGESTAHENFA